MNAYCSRVGKDLATVRFLFDGERIQPDATPKDVTNSSHVFGARSEKFLARIRLVSDFRSKHFLKVVEYFVFSKSA